MATLLLVAFIAGVLTVASPCVLTALPILLSTGSTGGRLRPLGIVLAFAVTFATFTLAFAGALQALALPAAWLRTLAIVALGLFGLALLLPQVAYTWERLLSPLARRGNIGRERSGFAGGLLVGAGLGLLWAPCAGPLMAFAIGLTAVAGVSATGVAITLAYTLGAGVPMLLIGYGTRGFAARAKRLGRNAGVVQRVFGGLTLLTCVALLFGLDAKVQALVPAEWNSALTAVERQDSVQKELAMLDNQAGSKMDAQPAPSSQPAQMPELPAMVAEQPTPVPPQPTLQPSPTPAPTPIIALQDLGPAPELTGIQQWINSDPLTIKQLRGKVVLIDFWTFGCYNCRNTRPYVRALYDKYKVQGLEIIGVHTPEFAYEKVPDNVRAAAREQGVTWPIALDPNFRTWNAYNNRYWPALYFIDANGHLRYSHFGEGNYDNNERAVQQLLSEAHAAR